MRVNPQYLYVDMDASAKVQRDSLVGFRFLNPPILCGLLRDRENFANLRFQLC